MANIEEPTWRNKHKIGSLMARVLKHANGEIEMTPSQINAAKLFLSKTVPDLNRSELTGKDGGAIQTTKELSELDKQLLEQYINSHK